MRACCRRLTSMEQTDLTVRGFDGMPAERDADLHNRNFWEVSDVRMTRPGVARN